MIKLKPGPRGKVLAPVAVAAACLLSAPDTPSAAGPAIDVAPHRAIYAINLSAVKNGSGVVSAHGALQFEWGDSCDGWTVEQRYRLLLVTAQQGEIEIVTNYATWESKDGLSYRFKVRKSKDGKPDTDISGEAKLAGPGKAGAASFTLPKKSTMDLPAGTIFPTEHTLVLLERAKAGDRIVPRRVFDGATPEGASDVNALIGRALATGVKGAEPLLDRPGWHMRMAYFSVEKEDSTQPDYEIGLDLQDNGIARALLLDYSEFTLKGTLEKFEPLPKPSC
ncbi:MAG: cell envelope integrity EipB family protein [Alphaproteobacteria bacterium]|nr:cell envelope integrity EipB family protein [Alphaproteobacteria bacterium]